MTTKEEKKWQAALEAMEKSTIKGMQSLAKRMEKLKEEMADKAIGGLRGWRA